MLQRCQGLRMPLNAGHPSCADSAQMLHLCLEDVQESHAICEQVKVPWACHVTQLSTVCVAHASLQGMDASGQLMGGANAYPRPYVSSFSTEPFGGAYGGSPFPQGGLCYPQGACRCAG